MFCCLVVSASSVVKPILAIIADTVLSDGQPSTAMTSGSQLPAAPADGESASSSAVERPPTTSSRSIPGEHLDFEVFYIYFLGVRKLVIN